MATAYVPAIDGITTIRGSGAIAGAIVIAYNERIEGAFYVRPMMTAPTNSNFELPVVTRLLFGNKSAPTQVGC